MSSWNNILKQWLKMLLLNSLSSHRKNPHVPALLMFVPSNLLLETRGYISATDTEPSPQRVREREREESSAGRDRKWKLRVQTAKTLCDYIRSSPIPPSAALLLGCSPFASISFPPLCRPCATGCVQDKIYPIWSERTLFLSGQPWSLHCVPLSVFRRRVYVAIWCSWYATVKKIYFTL